MKRKIFIGLMAVTCATALAFGIAGCDGNGEKKPNGGNNSNNDPPNYTPPDAVSSELFEYELNDDESGYVVTGLAEDTTVSTIIIPSTYNNLPVTAIGERAFGDCVSLTGVTISSGISIIGSGAFTGCINLPSFRFPSTITKISDSAFQNCSGLRALNFNGTSQLEVIEQNAFQNCTSLTGANIPDSVVTLGDRAFQGCSSLKSVTIGDSVETIGVDAFRGCTNLATVTIGNSLKHVAEGAFFRCSKISEMHFPDTLESVGLGALQECTGLKNLTLPFIGKEKYEVPVPEAEEDSPDNHTNFGFIFGANSIRDQASLDLNNLETLTITGDSPIGYHAFDSIGSYTNKPQNPTIGLSKIIITGNVKVIADGAFQLCYNLNTIVLPKSLTTIGRQILGENIKTVYYCGSEDDWGKMNVKTNNMYLLGTSEIPDPRYYYSESEPTETGKFWHYVDGVPTPWNK